MITKLKRSPGIYVVGFMAVGKTTIARLLAERLGWGFADLDEDIEAAAGSAITTIFETRGEAEFRRIETEALRTRVRAIEHGCPTVLALGGGAFVQPENFELIENNGVTVWLDCPLEIVRRRVAAAAHRPLARDPVQFETLYQARRQSYARADHRIVIETDDPATAVDTVLALPIFR
jgi:shikimate kinase